MVQILKRIGIGFALATLVVVIGGFMLPKDYSVSRTISISTPPDDIFPLISDLNSWHQWAPWFKADPSLEVVMGPITQGPGASQSWSGDTGRGQLVVTDVDLERGIAFDLSLDNSLQQATCTLNYEVTDDSTLVTWTVSGENGLNLGKRLYSLMIDPVMGPLFDEGLARLKLASECDRSAALQ